MLATGASRALLQQREGGGTTSIAAEAVQHGVDQLRHQPDRATAVNTFAAEAAARGEPLPETATNLSALLMIDGRAAGMLTLYAAAPRTWNEQDRAALRAAQADIQTHMSRSGAPLEAKDLRSPAVQAILDHLRLALGVQRCTFRQPAQDAYAFPVTYETRAENTRSLLGDFTIVQTGQPVIVKLLAERKQVVQDDCSTASTDPLFHKMLAHYGGMRSQVVTPFIVGDELKGVLSVHELRETRAWTHHEKAIAAEAATLIGSIFQVPPRA